MKKIRSTLGLMFLGSAIFVLKSSDLWIKLIHQPEKKIERILNNQAPIPKGVRLKWHEGHWWLDGEPYHLEIRKEQKVTLIYWQGEQSSGMQSIIPSQSAKDQLLRLIRRMKQ